MFTHKIVVGQASSRSLTFRFSIRDRRDVCPAFDRGNKKAPTHEEKGRQNGCASLLIFPKPMMLELELAPDIETKVQPVAVVSSGQSLNHSS
jgi:hypothetical protein